MLRALSLDLTFVMGGETFVGELTQRIRSRLMFQHLGPSSLIYGPTEDYDLINWRLFFRRSSTARRSQSVKPIWN